MWRADRSSCARSSTIRCAKDDGRRPTPLARDRRRRPLRHAREGPVGLASPEAATRSKGCAPHAAPSHRSDGPRQPSRDLPLPSNRSTRRTKTSGSCPRQSRAFHHGCCAVQGSDAGPGPAPFRGRLRTLGDRFLPLARIGFYLRHEPRRHAGSDGADTGDADEHQRNCNESASGSDREVIAVTDCRDGRR